MSLVSLDSVMVITIPIELSLNKARTCWSLNNGLQLSRLIWKDCNIVAHGFFHLCDIESVIVGLSVQLVALTK